MSARPSPAFRPANVFASADHRNAEQHIVADLGDLPVATGTGMKMPPITSSTAARGKASSVPPTINVKVPAVAPPTPPETGASTMAKPFCAAASLTSRAVATSIVELSMSKLPSGKHLQCRLSQVNLLDMATRRKHGDYNLGFGDRFVKFAAPCPPAATSSARAVSTRSKPVTLACRDDFLPSVAPYSPDL